jgi:cytoplasmic iron level regulating protein YaaA (DUF328/UPF0246 family)
MITVISPAKTLDLSQDVSTDINSLPVFSSEPERLIRKLKTLSRKKIASLMSLSEKLADVNYQRYQMWSSEAEFDLLKQAILMFKGDVYLGLEAETFSSEDYLNAQENLRILSGLYGYLKPMDLIQAYRLEMGTKLPIARKKNLYEFWGDKIAKEINYELAVHSNKYVINLASNEYFRAANQQKIKYPIITPVFKDFKNGEYKVISFFAKKARGMMAKWIVQNKVEEPEHLKLFDQQGYYFNGQYSTKTEFVFTRDEVK